MADAKTPVLNQYEAMFLLGPAYATDLDGAQKLVRGMVEKHGGQILLIKKWDERKLAYEINSQKRGVFIIVYYKGPGAGVAQIERDVTLGDEVLRVLITKADHLNTDEMAAVEPQPIQIREERNPWDRPGFNDDGRSRPRDDRPRDDRPRDDRPREDRPRDDRPREDRPARAPRSESPEAAVGKE